MSCDAHEFTTYKGVKLFQFPGSTAYFYVTSRMAIDADGAPNAYNPQNTGIDANANAGFPNGGWKSVIVADPAHPNKPFVQPSGEFQGFFVSKTTLEDSTLQITDPKRYVDSRKIPYLVFPGAFHQKLGTGTFGDFGAAFNLKNNKKSPLIVADMGATNHDLGEVSIKLAENLGGQNVNPRTGGGMPGGKIIYVVFPRTKLTPKWRVSSEQIQQKSDELLASIGGWERILECVNA
jgi:hypothetical protein